MLEQDIEQLDGCEFSAGTDGIVVIMQRLSCVYFVPGLESIRYFHLHPESAIVSRNRFHWKKPVAKFFVYSFFIAS
jgi:hypothetical protein